MNRLLIGVLMLAALALGVWHLGLGIRAMFVFRSGEPITSWIVILCGPLSTLPAVIVSCFRRRTAGYWLILGAVISFVALIISESGLTENSLPFLWMMAGPMAALGISLLLLAGQATGPGTARG
jgi:hypothetical protein